MFYDKNVCARSRRYRARYCAYPMHTYTSIPPRYKTRRKCVRLLCVRFTMHMVIMWTLLNYTAAKSILIVFSFFESHFFPKCISFSVFAFGGFLFEHAASIRHSPKSLFAQSVFFRTLYLFNLIGVQHCLFHHC